jgi:hypothetical protein
LVTRHRGHFVKQRLRLATQTMIELVRIEKNAECRVAPKPVSLLEEPQRWSYRRHWTSTKISRQRPNEPNEICCHRLETRLLADCSGGNSRPLHPSGVGGGHFLIKVRQ